MRFKETAREEAEILFLPRAQARQKVPLAQWRAVTAMRVREREIEGGKERKRERLKPD